MQFIPFPPEALRIGIPIPFALRDRAGLLLLARGAQVSTEAQRQALVVRELFVDERDGEAMKRAIAGKFDNLVRRNVLVGAIAGTAHSIEDLAPAKGAALPRLADPSGAWADVQSQVGAALRHPDPPEFVNRLLRAQAALAELLDRDSDCALLILVQDAMQEVADYSVRHAVFVAVVADLAARQLPDWDDASRVALRCGALTMNIGMTQMQNVLARQEGALSASQRSIVDGHAAAGVAVLRRAGVDDERWLDAVAQHHDSPPGPLGTRAPGARLARLIRRADIFAALISPRASRRGVSATAAAKAAYLDENQQPDEAGSAIVKAAGLYPPGSWVRLRNDEVALVLRRGRRANAPVAATIVNRHGGTVAEPSLRNTQLTDFEVAACLPAHDVHVRVNLERLLKL
jgi:HD-GYP domain-containing protein (c-di-GMP phosphodiesterase class II)